ncbi:hypothetical protein [Oceaniradius stylonematis]|uniref:hypothetical protein n=1 Tax=Oceaniradius stylonematis TaxID=2184161 RepID=UPI00273FFD37|nr:hypothetical protein [Oceaniradius stylonematis]
MIAAVAGEGVRSSYPAPSLSVALLGQPAKLNAKIGSISIANGFIDLASLFELFDCGFDGSRFGHGSAVRASFEVDGA